MQAVFSALLAGFATFFRTHVALQVEIIALPHQLAELCSKVVDGWK